MSDAELADIGIEFPPYDASASRFRRSSLLRRAFWRIFCSGGRFQAPETPQRLRGWFTGEGDLTDGAPTVVGDARRGAAPMPAVCNWDWLARQTVRGRFYIVCGMEKTRDLQTGSLTWLQL